MKKRFLFTALAVLVFISTSSAQSMGRTYKTALGIKVLDGAGISLKHFLNDRDALEGVAFFWSHGTRITGLYELHFDIDGAPGLKWYIGPGAHIGLYNT